MNRKSRMKSTLDSLFSSSKMQPPESEAPTPPPPVEKEEEKPVEPTPSKAPAEVKPAAKKKPAASAKPKPSSKSSAPVSPKIVESSPPAEPPAPVASTPAKKEEQLSQSQPVEEKPSRAVEKVEQSAELNAATAADSFQAPTGETKKTVESAASQEPLAGAAGNEKTEANDMDEEIHLVVFLLAGEAFGIDIQMVESIIKKQAITKVPHAAKYILGVTNLRGTVVPVVDLRERFCMPPQEATKDTRIVVLNSDGGKNGIVVDEVMEVMRLPQSRIVPTPTIATTINSSFIKGIARTDDKLIILLDVNSVLTR